MILQRSDVDKLIVLLKQHVPVDTGNLRDNGIQGIQVVPRGFIVQIGYPSNVLGNPATEDYAEYTETRNKSSLGWIKNCCVMWKNIVQPQLDIRVEGSVDQDVI